MIHFIFHFFSCLTELLFNYFTADLFVLCSDAFVVECFSLLDYTVLEIMYSNQVASEWHLSCFPLNSYTIYS